MGKTDAESLCKDLEAVFTIFGNPHMIVCDNGPLYNSKYFMDFCTRRGICLNHSPPYHPQSNGLIERSVQSVKKVLRKLVIDSVNNNINLTKC